MQPVLVAPALVRPWSGLLKDEAAERGGRHEAPHLRHEGRGERLGVRGGVHTLRAGLAQVDVDDDGPDVPVTLHQREKAQEPGVHALAVRSHERLRVLGSDVELAHP